MYKIETHLHTPVISPCGRLTPEELVLGYKAAGYAAITVTDHYKTAAFRYAGIDLDTPGSKLDAFLEGYRQVKAIGDREGIMVYYGAEIQFFENDNDYLLFGFSPELLADAKSVCAMGIAKFSDLARADGALLLQAHPFRKRCVPVAPHLIDGVEAVNRHDCQPNRNDLSIDFARRYGLLMTGGTDCHDPEDIGMGGIDADYLPKDSMELAKLLREGSFKILGNDTNYIL